MCYPRSAPKNDQCAGQLANRTLTNLYNQRPMACEERVEQRKFTLLLPKPEPEKDNGTR